jgi:hypothetical protein
MEIAIDLRPKPWRVNFKGHNAPLGHMTVEVVSKVTQGKQQWQKKQHD